MNNLFSEHIIHAVCDTLLYSLALGILLAVAAGIIIVSTRKASVKTRYNLLVAAFALFAGAVIFSFIKQLLIAQPVHPFYDKFTSPVTLTGISSADAGPVNDYSGITGFIRTHANTIVLLWSLIVVIKSFQLMTGLQSLTLLKRNRISSAGEYWEEQVRLLSKNLGIHRIVRVAASGIARVPMVIGHLKPVILLPVGLLTSLSPESIEAILVHELAHIRRRDWLVNLLVSVLEVIFFFNPAVLWISSLIRTERENCCDDIAIAYTGSKVNYIGTLVACEEFQQSSPAYSLAFSGRKKPLLARVRRMISDKNSSLSRAERGVMAAGLVVTLAGIIMLSPGRKKQTPVNQSFITTTDRPQYIFRQVSDSIIGQIDSLNTAADSIATFTIPDHPGLPDNDSIPVASASTKQASIKRATDFTIYEPKEISFPADVTLSNADVLTRLVKLDSNLYQVNSESGKIVSMQVNGKTVTPAQHLNYLEKFSRVTNNNRNHTSQPYIAEQDSYQQRSKAYHDEPDVDKLVAVLIAVKIIHYKEELLSFKLSDTEFIMNDIKMPDAVYLPLRKAFVPALNNGRKGSWAWMYNFKT